jgi:hypothetical protein
MIVQCVFIGFDSTLDSHILPDFSTLIKYPFNVRKRKGKTQVPPKRNYYLSFLENEVRRDLSS